MTTSRQSHITETPWDDNNWTKARYFSFIRSALRSATMKYPAKQNYLESKCRKAPAGSRAKKVVNCEECNLEMAKSHAHVDHVTPCGSLKDFSDVERFVKTLFCGVGNFEVLCKPCNEIYAFADRQNMTFNEAKVEKEAIKLMGGMTAIGQKEFLLTNGFIERRTTNEKKRRACFRELCK